MGNAVITVAMPRPRRSVGITSLTIASTSAPATPPHAPAAIRAASSQWNVGANAHASVAAPKPA